MVKGYIDHVLNCAENLRQEFIFVIYPVIALGKINKGKVRRNLNYKIYGDRGVIVALGPVASSVRMQIPSVPHFSF